MLRRDRQALGARHLVDFTVQIFEMKLGCEMFIIKANCVLWHCPFYNYRYCFGKTFHLNNHCSKELKPCTNSFIYLGTCIVLSPYLSCI